MAEMEFSRREAEDLARKLDSPQLQLSERERELLLAIFWTAGNQVGRNEEKSSGQTETLQSLREELLNAFIPGNAPDFIIRSPIILPDR
jgi:hypothetical protein